VKKIQREREREICECVRYIWKEDKTERDGDREGERERGMEI
jgi:hypothetical protein